MEANPLPARVAGWLAGTDRRATFRPNRHLGARRTEAAPDLLARRDGRRAGHAGRVRRERGLQRDNQTYAFLGAIHFDRPRFFVNLAGGYRRASSFNDSSFPDYATTVGSYFASWRVAGPLELQSFGHRRPIYSRSNTALFYIETRYGGRVQLWLGSRTSVYGYGEVGTNFYPVQFLSNGEHRDDDGIAYGGGLTFRFLQNVAVQLEARQNNLKPSTGDPERKVFRFTTGLSFNGEFKRE